MNSHKSSLSHLDRRQLLRGGAYLALGGAAWALGLIPEARSADTITPFVLMIYVSGGWDQTMVFDNKTESGYVTQEPGAKAATGGGNLPYIDHPNRPSVKKFFDTYGANAAIVNGINNGSMDRRQAILNSFGAVPKSKNRPVDWLSFYTISVNPVLQMPHTIIDAPYLPGEYTSVNIRLTTAAIKEYVTAAPTTETLGVDGETALNNFRKNAYGDFYKSSPPDALDGEKLVALHNAYAREPTVAAALTAINDDLGVQGTDSDFVRNGRIAIELFATGRSQAVTLQAGPDDNWETTGVDHFAKQSANYETLFAGINTILEHAAKRSVADRMTLMVVSERGRAPRVNDVGGKSPWAFTSMLTWGAGIAGGIVAGLTDDALRGLPVDPIFGTQVAKGGVTLEMGNVMAAYYLKTNVPASLIVPNYKPLTPIIKKDA